MVARTQLYRWISASVNGLAEVRERLEGVVILSDDALKVIRQQDGDCTLFYCDPPYMHETRQVGGPIQFTLTNENA